MIAATSGRRRFSSRSFCVPMTFARRVSTIIRTNSGQGIRRLYNSPSAATAASVLRRRPAGQTDYWARSVSGLVRRPFTRLVVQVGAGRAAGGADVADHVAALDLLAAVDREPREVAVARDDAEAVVEHRPGCRRRRWRRRCDDAVAGGEHRLAVVGRDVEAGMEVRAAGERIRRGCRRATTASRRPARSTASPPRAPAGARRRRAPSRAGCRSTPSRSLRTPKRRYRSSQRRARAPARARG